MAFSKSTALPKTSSHSRTDRERAQSQYNVADVLAATDIVELIGEVVQLTPRGRGDKREMIGLCPFHSDSTPSFEVNGAKGVYSCWSCSAGLNGSRGGDALTFVRRYFGMSFKEALRYLADRNGHANIARPQRNSIPSKPVLPPAVKQEESRLSADKNPLFATMQQASKIFSQNLARSPNALEYLFKDRGISADIASRYAIGYATQSFRGLAPHFKNYLQNDDLINTGLARKTESGRLYDFFRDRLMFGIRDENGRVVGFGGRRMSDDPVLDKNGTPLRIPKYINSPETAIFSKKDTLFGLYEAREDIKQAGYALIVEGYMDVLALAGRGIGNALACMGTALSPEQIQKVSQYSKNLVFCLDGDDAGVQGALRGLNAIWAILDENLKISFAILPDKMDPDTYIKKYGKETFLLQIQSAKNPVQFWEEATLQHLEQTPSEGKSSLIKASYDLLNRLPDSSPYHHELEELIAKHTPSKTARTEKNDSPSNASTFRFGVSKSFAEKNHRNVLNSPSERLFMAAMKMPELGAQIAHEIKNFPIEDELREPARIWRERLGKSLDVGRSCTHAILLPHQSQRYESVLAAATTIFSQYLEEVRNEKLAQAHAQGAISQRQYLDYLQRNCLDKPG